MKYKVLIHDRTYEKHSFLNIETNEIMNSEYFKKIQPAKEKMFSKDVFNYTIENPDSQFEHVYSQIRSGIQLAGILILENNKTFGRTANKKRLLYKCVPDDMHLPVFLVPYEIKIGFSKMQKNKYVIFKFDHWEHQHPQGILLETLGDIGDHNVFYEYQLYCKSLHISLTDFTKSAKDQLLKKTNDEHIELILRNPDFNIEDRRKHRVFTIDPENSLDFDDGFGFIDHPDGTIQVSIYIANVYFWLEILGLWRSFSSRVSTIYLPDRKRPMLPTVLSDNLCSLQENETRFTFVLDVFFDAEGNFQRTEYKNAAVSVFKNFHYEEPALLYKTSEYSKLFKLTSLFDNTVCDSHDLVSYWMVFMNKTCGQWMSQKQIGIFRSSSYKNHLVYERMENDESISKLEPNTQRVIKQWNNTAGQYVIYGNNTMLDHEIMKTKTYIHITSPIRRLVDLLNMFWISREMGIIQNTSVECLEFFCNWISKIEYINDSMRAIRKIQIDCELVHRFFTNPTISQGVYEGTLFGKIVKNDGSILYMVYLETLGLLSRINTHVNLANYERRHFKIFLFEDEDKVKKKIRLQLCENELSK